VDRREAAFLPALQFLRDDMYDESHAVCTHGK
jgi:hypothetical protein